MRVMVIVKASPESESGAIPTGDMLNEMGRFNAELVRAGVMLAGEGLQATSKGKRIRFGGKGQPKKIIDGPFAETKELVGGFWLWQVKSMEEAVEWLKRAPFQDAEVEIRPLFEAQDFAPSDPTGEIREREADLRKKVEAQRH